MTRSSAHCLGVITALDPVIDPSAEKKNRLPVEPGKDDERIIRRP
jgi:hypothetical protein